MIKIGNLLRLQTFLAYRTQGTRLKCVQFYPFQLNVTFCTSENVRKDRIFSSWLEIDQWPGMDFINGRKYLKRSAARPFWQNLFGFVCQR